MSIQTELTRITNAKAAIKTAIEGKGVTVPAGTLLDGMAALIESIEAGGGGTTPYAKWNDVTFIDYDGSVLYSYSLAEVSALTQLPELPSHDGLICQGWNWTLEGLKELNRPVTVGAMYITDDGSTRLRIRIATEGRMTVPLYIGQSVANGVSIDWGDGSASQTLSGTGDRNTMHTYSDPGDYVISLMPNDGCTLSFGKNSSTYCVMGATVNEGKLYCNMLQSVFVGKNVPSISNYAFQSCGSLTRVTIPAGVTSIGSNAFQRCFSLVSVTIPNMVTSIGSYAFYGCYSLASITIPDGVTSIGSYAFYNCYSLAIIIIPDGVTSIDAHAFGKCYGMRYYDFSSFTNVPSLQNASAFDNIPSDCEMLIPTALFNEWSTATNWTTYAHKMVAV